MQYFKRCSCSHVNVYNADDVPPMFCENCGRELMFVAQEVYEGQQDGETKPKYAFVNDYSDEEETVEEEVVEPVAEETPVAVEEEPDDWINPGKLTPYIIFPDGSRVAITCSCVIGRTATGQHYLKSFPFVSKGHFGITPRESGIGVTITDYSTFGTYINKQRIEKNRPTPATSGAVINLAGRIDLKLEIK